jgi:hypothetical protein
MKKILFFLLALASAQFLFAEAPQGINYQAVAMNASGVIANKNISLRLSIVDSIASGNVLYTETHNTTTDAIGSFSVVIGNGTITLGNFSNINWAKNYKWLKTEIDTLGGSSFVVMGITQFMSTPYALFANKTKATYADIIHPDGFDNITMVVIGTTPYIVPVGKNLFSPKTDGGYLINGTDTLDGGTFSEGQTISATANLLCYLIDKKVNWGTFNLGATSITPPTGKSFVIITARYGYNSFISFSDPNFYFNTTLISNGVTILLNGTMLGYSEFNHFLIVPSGVTLSMQPSPGASGNVFVNGYFIDN